MLDEGRRGNGAASKEEGTERVRVWWCVGQRERQTPNDSKTDRQTERQADGPANWRPAKEAQPKEASWGARPGLFVGWWRLVVESGPLGFARPAGCSGLPTEAVAAGFRGAASGELSSVIRRWQGTAVERYMTVQRVLAPPYFFCGLRVGGTWQRLQRAGRRYRPFTATIGRSRLYRCT